MDQILFSLGLSIKDARSCSSITGVTDFSSTIADTLNSSRVVTVHVSIIQKLPMFCLGLIS